LCFISKSALRFLIQDLALHQVLMDSLLLELLAPRRLGVSCESPNLMEDYKKVCITHLFVQRLVCGLDLCGRQRGGLGLKETWLFVAPQRGSRAPFVLLPNLGINFVFLLIMFVRVLRRLTIPWKNCLYLFGVWILKSALLISTTLNPVDHLEHPICKGN
jgi:hypothetical protein